MPQKELTDRQRQILQSAIDIIANEGYASLSMRALARASGMKLGALQYHFRTWEDMLHALCGFISDEYERSFDALAESNRSQGLLETVRFLVSDTPADEALQAYWLFPQLWAMARVEPTVKSLLDDFYDRYLEILQEGFADAGSEAPRAEAIALVSLVEGTALFLAPGSRWARDSKSVRETLYGIIRAKYPDGKNSGA